MDVRRDTINHIVKQNAAAIVLEMLPVTKMMVIAQVGVKKVSWARNVTKFAGQESMGETVQNTVVIVMVVTLSVTLQTAHVC